YRTVYGLPITLDGISAAGRTDTWLLAEPLRASGMGQNEINRRMRTAFDVMEDYVETHLGSLEDRVLPGVPELLRALSQRHEHLGLLTGNLRRIAVAKMTHAGLDGYFQEGGFGEESSVRAHLVPVAVAKASAHSGRVFPPRRVFVIGDTPMDIEAGLEHGMRTVGVATGPYSLPDLKEAGAETVLASFADTEATLAELERLAAGS
ncbi:MAG: HAD family hydrolase, partial [Chloroflexota bacterium]